MERWGMFVVCVGVGQGAVRPTIFTQIQIIQIKTAKLRKPKKRNKNETYIR